MITWTKSEKSKMAAIVKYANEKTKEFWNADEQQLELFLQ